MSLCCFYIRKHTIPTKHTFSLLATHLKSIYRLWIFLLIVISKVRRSCILNSFSILINWIVISTCRILIDLLNDYLFPLKRFFDLIIASLPNFLITTSTTLAISLTKISSVFPTLDLWNITIQLNLLFKLFTNLNLSWILGYMSYSSV